MHAGYAHIGEAQEGLPDDARPMAMELAKMSGLPLLTIDQTSTRSYEAADIDTVGQRLAKQFAVNVPSVLVSREGGEAWSYRPGPVSYTHLDVYKRQRRVDAHHPFLRNPRQWT